MSNIDGKWKVTVTSPMGAQVATWALKVDGSELTGTVSGQQGTTEIQEGSCEGDSLKFSFNVQSPMPLKLSVSATVDGDCVSGQVNTMMFGSFPLEGTRVIE